MTAIQPNRSGARCHAGWAFALPASPALLHEYRQVLLRPKLMRLHGLSEEESDRLLTELTANALWREPAQDEPESAPDPGNNHLWALLASAPDAYW